MKGNVDRIPIPPDVVEFQELNFPCALNGEKGYFIWELYVY